MLKICNTIFFYLEEQRLKRLLNWLSTHNKLIEFSSKNKSNCTILISNFSKMVESLFLPTFRNTIFPFKNLINRVKLSYRDKNKIHFKDQHCAFFFQFLKIFIFTDIARKGGRWS